MPMQPAVLGTARLNNFRLNYLPAALVPLRATKVGIYLSGVPITGRVKVGSLRISDILNDAPNTCGFVFYGPTAPQPNQKLVVTLNSDTPIVLFSGTLQTIAISYVGRPNTVAWDCAAIDDTALANRRRPFGVWNRVSATTVAIELITTYAPDLSTAGIEAGLPLVDIFLDGTEGMSAAFAQLAQLVGAYFKFEDGIAYLFTELADDPCDPIDAAHPFLDEPPVTSSADVSQLRTRVYGRGHGETVPVDVAAGETILPVEDAVMFDPIGGLAIAGTTPDGAPTQILAYTGVRHGGAGSLVGPGAAPSVAPAAALVAGAGINSGTHGYAYTFVTGAGESLASPARSVSLPGLVPGATTFNSWIPGLGVGGLAIGATYEYACAWSTSATAGSHAAETVVGALVAIVAQADGGGGSKFNVINLPFTADPTILYVMVYRRLSGGAYHYLGTRVNNDPLTTWNDGASDATVAGNPGPSNTIPSGNQVSITGIAIGGATVTQRKLYRTVAGGSQLKLLTTIANNSATTYTDSTADASLGANVPSTDASGLTQPSGQVNAGSISLITASAAPFPSSGWALLGGRQAVRYTGISGNTLTGIPASGPGALLTTVVYGTQVLPAPALIGVTGLVLPMQNGAPVYIWVQRDDLSAQATETAIDVANGRVRADGVYEGPILVDERRGIPSLTALCDATLAIFSRPIQSVRYATRDIKAKSGKPVTVNLASPPIAADLVIQEVQISEIDIAPGLAPRFEVTASSTRFSLDSLLRKLTKALGV